ncbi:hypothetical protein EMCRGX_G020703 [Ephydatia muelleri]
MALAAFPKQFFLVALPKKVQALVAKVQALVTKVQALVAKVQALVAKVQALVAKVQALVTKVQALVAKVQALVAKVQALVTTVQALVAKVQALVARLKKLSLIALPNNVQALVALLKKVQALVALPKKRNLVLAAGASSDVLIRDDGAAMIEQLRDKFASSTSRSEKLTILTVLPKSWSIAKIVNVFGVTKCMARIFYESREKEHRQKRLVLCNLTEAYRQCIPDIKVGFSKFAELRPKECVLAGATGTHSKLQLHDFIAKNQATFLAEKKESLSSGEFLVIADFSENYSFVVQDEVQSFHWNNLQATVHPFLCNFKDGDGKINSICFTVISENNQHDNISVHLFQRKLISFLTDHFGKKPKRIMYMSDGCAGQYKNCYNFTNLCHHEEDFGIQAEWHFFATSHGKSAADVGQCDVMVPAGQCGVMGLAGQCGIMVPAGIMGPVGQYSLGPAGQCGVAVQDGEIGSTLG